MSLARQRDVKIAEENLRAALQEPEPQDPSIRSYEPTLMERGHEALGALGLDSLSRGIKNTGALAKTAGVAALDTVHSVASLPRGVAGAIHAEPGERLEGFSEGYQERHDSIPGGQWIDSKYEEAAAEAEALGLPPIANILAEFGAPDPGDIARLAKYAPGLAAFLSKFVAHVPVKNPEYRPASGMGGQREGPGGYSSDWENPFSHAEYQRMFELQRLGSEDPGAVRVGDTFFQMAQGDYTPGSAGDVEDFLAREASMRGSLRELNDQIDGLVDAQRARIAEPLDPRLKDVEWTGKEAAGISQQQNLNTARLQQLEAVRDRLRVGDIDLDARREYVWGPFSHDALVDAEHEEFLQFNSLMSEQPQHVLDALDDLSLDSDFGAGYNKAVEEDWSGQQFFETLVNQQTEDIDRYSGAGIEAHRKAQERVADEFADLGITGNQYTDNAGQGMLTVGDIPISTVDDGIASTIQGALRDRLPPNGAVTDEVLDQVESDLARVIDGWLAFEDADGNLPHGMENTQFFDANQEDLEAARAAYERFLDWRQMGIEFRNTKNNVVYPSQLPRKHTMKIRDEAGKEIWRNPEYDQLREKLK